LRNSSAFSLNPCARATVSAATPSRAAYSRTSCVIFIEQNFGSHIEQK
jgi:hypothetical protein